MRAPANTRHLDRVRRPRHARRVAAALAGAALGLGALAPLNTARAATDVSLRPASGTFTVTGRGFGHGRGMSQWGAYGAAESGLTWPQILDFYYPGTVRRTGTDAAIRVWISGDDDGSTTVLPAPGLTLTVGATRRALPASTGIRAWRATRTGSALTVTYLDAAGRWQPYTVPSARDVAFAGSGATLRLVLPSGAATELRGAVHAVVDGTRVRTVVHTDMETYLRGVVPAEMPAQWHLQALAAQSVAARTYAASYRASQRARGATYDICDSQACQVYTGAATYTPGGARYPRESPRADAAITLTAGTVLRTGAGPLAPFAFTEFSASNGGYTVAGGPSYQVAKPDPYDGKLSNPSTSWSRTVSVASLERVFGVGALRTVRVTARDGHGAFGGRVERVVVDGSRGSATKTGQQLRLALGLKSAWFVVSSTTTTPDGPSAPSTPTAPTTPASPVRDLDSDTRPDLVSMDGGDGSLWLRDIATNGALAPARRIGRGWSGMNALLAVGQFDGAGGQDLIARTATTGALVLYRGDGTGNLSRPVRIGTGFGRYTSLTAVGDVDRNGTPDLVGLDTRTRRLVLVPGRAGGRLGAARTIGAAAGVTKVTGAGDVDRDGRPDLLTVTTRGELVLHVGNGTGTFTRRASLGRGWERMRALVSPGDVTGDGRPDLLVHDTAERVLMYPGAAATTYGAARVVATGVTLVVPAR